MYIARAFAQRTKLDEAINEIRPALGPDVVRLNYSLEEDWSGDSSIFFRIILSDEATRRDRLRNTTSHIESLIEQRLEPVEQWGVLPYFSFRSQLDQAVLKEKAWA